MVFGLVSCLACIQEVCWKAALQRVIAPYWKCEKANGEYPEYDGSDFPPEYGSHLDLILNTK